MAIFNSYVKLPEGNPTFPIPSSQNPSPPIWAEGHVWERLTQIDGLRISSIRGQAAWNK